MQGTKAKVISLDYYPRAKEIFRELARRAGSKLLIPAREKEINFSIEEPLTNQEKEEGYKINLYINTFVSEETPVEGTGQLKIIIKPLTAQREETHTK